MRTATITELKNHLSAFIDQVRAGESVLILDRGRAVARLEPVVRHRDATGRLERLERAGILQSGSGPPPLNRLRQPPPALEGGASVVQALLDERGEGR
jgi:prevent-host-death family protein